MIKRRFGSLIVCIILAVSLCQAMPSLFGVNSKTPHKSRIRSAPMQTGKKSSTVKETIDEETEPVKEELKFVQLVVAFAKYC